MNPEPRIGLNITGSKEWMGGVSYLHHMASALHKIKTRYSLRVLIVCNANMIPSLVLHETSLRVSDGLIIRDTKNTVQASPEGYSAIVVKSDEELFEHIDILLPITLGVFTGYPALSWIPDFQYKHLPHLNTEEQLQDLENLVQKVAEESEYLYFSSKDSQKDFAKFYPEAKCRQFVLPFCTVPDFDEIERGIHKKSMQHYDLNRKYFICPNQFWQHKGHDTLFQAVKELKDEGISLRILCTGTGTDPRSPSYRDRLLEYLKNNHLQDQIIMTGMLSYESLMQLLVHSWGIVHPTRFEGWSTVVEDARSLEIPIILSDLPVHREQNPPRSQFVRLDDVQDLKNAMANQWSQVNREDPQARFKEARHKSNERIQDYGERIWDVIQLVLQEW